MTKTIKVIAAALALALPVAVSASPALAQVQMQSSTPLPVLTIKNLASELGGDKPAFVIVSGATCDACPELERLSAKYPSVKFYRANGGDFDTRVEALPVFLVNVPNVGITFQKTKFATGNLESFVAQRAQFAERQTAAALNLRTVREKIKTVGRPFEDQLQALSAEYVLLWKPYAERIAVAVANEEAAKASFEDELYEFEERLWSVRKPILDELSKVRKQIAAAIKADAQSASYRQTMQELTTSINEEQRQLDQMIAQGIVEKDDTYRASSNRLERLQAKYSELLTALREREELVSKSFSHLTQPLQEQLYKIAQEFSPQRAELDAKILEATKPLADETARIKEEGKAMLQPHFDRVDMAKASKARAIAPLQQELERARQELEKSLDERANNSN